jgi:alkylhydroperoxidase/carboxymuconolactone decarboxylase family protein YurZ
MVILHSPCEHPKMPDFRIPLTSRHSQLAEGWQRLERAGRDGPLDDHTCQIIELAVAIATAESRRLRAHLDRARNLGITDAEIDQLIALAAPSIGTHATLAAYDAADLEVPTTSPPDAPARPWDP